MMNECICRSASHCEDYPIEIGCLFIGEAANGINPRLGRPVTREEAHAHINRAQKAGLVHLVGRNKLDTLWLGVGPGHKLLTVCNCCPCCCLWRMLPDLHSRIGQSVMRMPGLSLSVSDKCTGCGRCVDACFASAIVITDGHAVITDQCRGCGRCVEVCPHGAISLRIDVGAAVQRTLQTITEAVDVSSSKIG